jgi:hypothetical protein
VGNATPPKPNIPLPVTQTDKVNDRRDSPLTPGA